MEAPVNLEIIVIIMPPIIAPIHSPSQEKLPANNTHHFLAVQLQQALGALEQAGVELAAAQRRQRRWVAAALALALLAMVLAGYALWR